MSGASDGSASSPFRREDLTLRIDALRAERDDLVRQLLAARAELEAMRRWSWGRFFLGVALPIVVVLVTVAAHG